MRILGDIGYGGPSGFVSSCAEVLFEAIFGDDVGGTAISWLTGGDDDKAGGKTAATAADPSVQLASTDPSVALPDPVRTEAATAYALFARESGTHR